MNTKSISSNGIKTPEILRDIPTQIASVLAHEVRNPLTNINLALEMLELNLKDEEDKVYMDIIKRSAARIGLLINDLLHNRASEKHPEKQYSVHAILNEVIEMAGDRIRLKNIIVIKDYSAVDCITALRATDMMIALTNIVINAVDAMTDGGILKLVTVANDDIFVLRVEDNGCGISAENMKSIFTPYFTNKPGGMGLGLATTRDLLRMNNVSIGVKSAVGEGSRFSLEFKKKVPK